MRIPVLPLSAPCCSSTAIYAEEERASFGCTVKTPNWLILAAGILFLTLVMKCADKTKLNTNYETTGICYVHGWLIAQWVERSSRNLKMRVNFESRMCVNFEFFVVPVE